MLEKIVAGLGGKQDYARLQALCADLVTQNDALRLKVAQLQAENRQLRRRLADRELRQLRKAEADAALIGGLLFAQMPTTRAACLDYGISRRRWTWAMALLQIGLVRRHDGGWRDVSMETFESALRGAVGIVERDGLQALVDRMPRNGYSGEHKTRRQGRAVSADSHAASHAQSHAILPRRDQYTSTSAPQTSARAGRFDLIPSAH
jgi:hypothetical protein